LKASTVTRTFDQDFRYLLVHLVPRHRLSPDLRRDVDRALRGNAGAEIRRQSVRALQALCETSYLEHAGVAHEDGNVVLAYRRPHGAMRLRVALPRSEWEELAGGEPLPAVPAATGPVPAPEVEPPPAAAPTAAPSGDLLAILPELSRSFTVSDGATPVLDRLDHLIATLESWLDFSSGHLQLLEDTLVVGSDDRAGRVRVVGEDLLRENELVRGAVEAGARRYASLAGADRPVSGAIDRATLGVAPIFLNGRVVGALQARFEEVDRAAVDARLEAAAMVIRNAIEFNHRFASLTSIDSLTGIYNRQFLDRQLPVEIERAMRSGVALSMLVLDVDDFKRINDELGHKKGDEALVAIADIIRRNLRKVDMPFRYGGEEIVILLPGTPEFEALHTAERLRRVVSQYRGFRDALGRIRDLTVSVGVAVYPDTARSGEQLFAQADEAMYRAKQRGKNQVVLYSKK
jgi:diguanylate cyclase (GGDEF)-like protein